MLRENEIVKEWIRNYHVGKEFIPNCKRCGWPHRENLLCCIGSYFGEVTLGTHTFYIDSSNVEFMLGFVTHFNKKYHRIGDLYFRAVNGDIHITHMETYNNCPRPVTHAISKTLWDSMLSCLEKFK